MKKAMIEWCDSTVNPVVGCTHSCEYCYAMKLNDRFKWIDDWNKPEFFPERLKQLKSNKSYNIFMNSMSDIADWEKEWVEATFKAIHDNPQNNYLFLTKRPLYADRFIENDWLEQKNVWFGATYTGENGRALEQLLSYGENCNIFLSIEPLLDYPALINSNTQDIERIKWIIIGAETGNRKNKVTTKKQWTDKIVEFAMKHDIPVLMKNSLVEIVGVENMIRYFPKQLEKQFKNHV